MTDRLSWYFREDYGKISVRINHVDLVMMSLLMEKQTRSRWTRLLAKLLVDLDLKKMPGVFNTIHRILAEAPGADHSL